MRDLSERLTSLLDEWFRASTPPPAPAQDQACAPADARDEPPALEELEPLKLVGKGGFASVVLVRHTVTGQPFALKTMDRARVSAQSQQAHVNAERAILEACDHPFIVKLFGSFRTATTLNLLLEYTPGGDLYFHLNRLGVFDVAATRFYSAQLVLALRHVHSLGAVYRDLKPENILFDAQGHVRLADFGLSKLGLHGDARTYSLCGTAHYLAPEVITKAGYGREADFWALGCLMYELLTGLPPFYSKAKNRQRLYRAIRGGDVEYPADMDPVARDLIERLLCVDPEARITAEEMLAHPFFEGLDLGALERLELPAPLARDCEGDADSTSNVDPEFTSQPLSSLAAFSVAAYNGCGLDEEQEDEVFGEWTWACAPLASVPGTPAAAAAPSVGLAYEFGL